MLDALTVTQFISCFIIILTAFTVRGITGFGSGLIAIPLLALMFPVSIAVPLLGILDYISALTHGIKLRSDIRWKQILPLFPFSLLGVVSALYLFNTVDALLLKKSLGIFIIIYAIYSLLTIKPHTHKSIFWAIPGGIFGGLIGALFGTGGPFYVIYLQLQGLTKATFRASIAIIFLLDGSARIIAYSMNGFYTRDIILLILVSLPIMMLGMYIGEHVHTNISQQTMRKGIGVLLLLSGSALIW
ncbi:MAG: sulfite exporter TauE/SafE family protein [gamma proteobacterium symbiont of Taylorina sp.]|nr:sulfite exporter TauE/SafE family protein [gamma proteobacterium symbiont of Taylorina sp.]